MTTDGRLAQRIGFGQRTRRRLLFPGTITALFAMLSLTVVAPPAYATSRFLTRAPYLTDLSGSSVEVNFATAAPIVKVQARYGKVSGNTCHLTSVTRPITGKLTFIVAYPGGAWHENQWKVQISGLSSGTYCYRVDGATSTTATTYADLLGVGTTSPRFHTVLSAKFAVLGDWGQTGSGVHQFQNIAQTNNISHIAASGASFVISTGDIGYPGGNPSNYGDLLHRGPNVSAVFGPDYWPRVGQSLPMYPVPGNHGFNPTFTSTWPLTAVAAASHGQAGNITYTINGRSVSVPAYWFAYNVAGWRIYNLTAAWGDTFPKGANSYAEDYRRHWASGASERTWLTRDLNAHASMPKIAVFHFPLYSAVRTGDVQDKYLTAPPDHSQSLEKLLATHRVKLVLNGHSHIYERNNPHNGLVSIVSGGGGGVLSPVDGRVRGLCSQKYSDTGRPVVAVALGWSSNGGSSCNHARPTSFAQVDHTLRVTLSGASATVQAVNSTGVVFDSTTVR